MPKRKEPSKSLRIKVISMGNAEVGKVSGARREGRDLRAAGRRTHWLREQPLKSGGPASSPPPNWQALAEVLQPGELHQPDLFDLWVTPLLH